MTPAQTAVIVVTIAAVALVAFALVMRSRRLRQQFGPQYNRAVAETGNRFKAEAQLEKVEKRVKGYDLRPLTAVDRDRFQQSWRAIQSQFVDSPSAAFVEADQLLGEAMAARGYPPKDFEDRAAEISVHHSTVAENYRAGHDIAIRQARGNTTTEELRQGMVHYRTLFDELVQDDAVPLRARAATQGVS
ncbi:MAG: hypothetical protein WA823_16715 [Candidatus Acidiferrales bacterium]